LLLEDQIQAGDGPGREKTPPDYIFLQTCTICKEGIYIDLALEEEENTI
jgi:hypothetical protein